MEYVTVSEVASALQVTERTVRRWCLRQLLPAVRAGSLWRIRADWPEVLREREAQRADG